MTEHNPKERVRQDISALGVEMASLLLKSEQKTRVLLEAFLGTRRAIEEGHPDA